jgi:hypothetical protein
MSGAIESIPQHCPKSQEKKLNRFVMFMCYATWLALRVNIKISGILGSKSSRDLFKEMQASIHTGLYIMINFAILMIPIFKFKLVTKDIGTGLLVISFLTMLCFMFWLDSFENIYYRMFERFSKPLKRKWDRYVLFYWTATWVLFWFLALALD